MKAIFQKFKNQIKGRIRMVDTIDVHDLPEAEANMIQDFVEYLRRKLKTKQFIKEEKEKEKEWSELAITSFSEDWENEKDAIYDNWQKHYHVSER